MQALETGELKVYDRQEQLISHLPLRDGLQIPLGETESLPENVTRAFLTIEDERFYSHWGVDVLAKLRALRDNLKAKQIVSGGSTITEQYLKNKYFPLAQRTILQKLREANLAFYTSVFSKKENIIRSYLDTIYFGNRNYGLKAAMKAYFDKAHLETLTDSELVTLIAIIRSPGTINTSEKFFQERFQRIMEKLTMEIGSGSPLLRGWGSEEAISTPEISFEPFQGFDKFPHVTAAVRQIVVAGHDPHLQDENNASIQIFTTIDSDLQNQAREFIDNSLTRLEGKNVTNGALYVVQPQSGDILVWQGSRDFHSRSIDGQVNVLTQRRQLGSALKPFIYLYAFSQGAHPDQLTVDLEKDFDSAKDDEFYRPLNYGLREGGVMPLKMALANSFNIASVRLLDHLGLQETYSFLEDLGLDFNFDAHHYGLSLALGSPDLTMQNVADTYGLLANDGININSHLIRSVGDNSETEKLPLDPQPLKRGETSPAFEDNIAGFYLFQTLSKALNRRRSFGTNSILNTSIPFAVKTGTTKNFHDNWTFGYHPDLVVAAWVGNNDNSPMIDVDGITGAGPIWHRTVEAAIEAGYVTHREYPQPSTLSSQQKCLNSSCSRTELVYQEEGQEWYSELESGHFCLEDFFIQDIDTAEISKVAKLFDFADFSIDWCNNENSKSKIQNSIEIPVRTDVRPGGQDSKLEILKPQDGEVFYIRRDTPLELQEIILKANQEVEWYVDGDKVGSEIKLFIQPIIGKHQITAKTNFTEEQVNIEIIEDSS